MYVWELDNYMWASDQICDQKIEERISPQLIKEKLLQLMKEKLQSDGWKVPARVASAFLPSVAESLLSYLWFIVIQLYLHL